MYWTGQRWSAAEPKYKAVVGPYRVSVVRRPVYDDDGEYDGTAYVGIRVELATDRAERDGHVLLGRTWLIYRRGGVDHVAETDHWAFDVDDYGGLQWASDGRPQLSKPRRLGTRTEDTALAKHRLVVVLSQCLAAVQPAVCWSM